MSHQGCKDLCSGGLQGGGGIGAEGRGGAISWQRSRSPEMRQQGHPEVKHPVKHLDQY